MPGRRAGTFAAPPRGIMLHATRSGLERPEREEFDSTMNYVRGGADGKGWHATAGPGVVAEHLEPHEWGWHVREESGEWLALEFAQGQLGLPISPETLQAAAWYAATTWVPEYGLRILDELPFHSERPPGIRDGNTDTFPRNTLEGLAFKTEFRRRVLGMVQ